MTEPTKYCASCRTYKPESQLIKKKVPSINGRNHTVLRCDVCWARRGR